MMTFGQLTTRAQDIVGTTDSTVATYLKQDINQGLRLFKNAARRYWTRVEKVASLVASQQYYQLPEDAVRVTEVRVNTGTGSMDYPLIEIASEHRWNQLNVVPTATINVPQFYFVRGRDEVGLWPTPSTSVTDGLQVSYEPRLVDMAQADVTTGTVTVTNGSVTVTHSGTSFSQQMIGSWLQVTDGTDGNWYKIAGFTSTSVITLENYYQGIGGAGRTFIIGQAPDIPEDYQLGLVYFAAYNYFLRRKDMSTATLYQAMFNTLFIQYKETYSSKVTGVVQTQLPRDSFNLWNLPPQSIS